MVKIVNFPNAWVSGKFPKFPVVWGIPQISSHLRNIRILKNIPPSKGNFGNSSNAWEARNFPKYMGICEIPKFLFSSKV